MASSKRERTWRAIWADKGLPAFLRREMQKHNQYTRNWNEVKRIIVPNGYSNDWEGDCVRTCDEGLQENGNPKTQVQRATWGTRQEYRLPERDTLLQFDKRG